MKTKANYPYIYFFDENNVVFVYKIEAERYLTLDELHHTGEWQTYEIESPGEFDRFHHEEYQPLVGRGFAVRLDEHVVMLENINKQIQKHLVRQGDAPVHITVSESAAGSLRFGLERPKTVIGFPDFFEIGPLWRLQEKDGQDFRFEWLGENINTGMDDYEHEIKYLNTLLEIEDIPEQVSIYLWTANNAKEQTGIRYILTLLAGKSNDIYLINSTDFDNEIVDMQDEFHHITHTSEIHPDKLKHIFETVKGKPLSDEEKRQYQKEWRELAEGKQVLRIWKDSRIISVSEDYYDSLILDTIRSLQQNDDYILTARAVGATLAQMQEPVSDSYLEYRIRHMVYNQKLELKGIPKSMRHYSVRLPAKATL
ncbi:DUF1835 domain-containing protein [Neobacillus dielmonensis]|uniref:DUF1835 domain-containing protein n=1 Tax=Neobacillus dielmonensis TaxID=1347369 RepID=UPI0005A6685B|nr:DUF1835 domain-containing protein [Neobacillus dielmonensis]